MFFPPSQVNASSRLRMRWCPSSVGHVLRCVLLRSCPRRGRHRLPMWMRLMWAYVKLLIHSLFFNTLTDSDVVFDSVFEPVFWTVDYVTRWFGMVSVCARVYLFNQYPDKHYSNLTVCSLLPCRCEGVCVSGGHTD